MPIRLLPDRLSQWLVALVVGAILATQALALSIYHADRMRAVDSADARQAAQCLAGFVQMLAPQSPDRRQTMISPLLLRGARDHDASDKTPAPVRPAPTQAPDGKPVGPSFMIRLPELRGKASDDLATDGNVMPDQDPVQVDSRLPDGTLLTLVTRPSLGRLFTADFIAYLTGMVMVGVLGSIWVIALATRPLRRLSEAADRFGRDVNAPPIPETGPREVRQAAAAFNSMQRRLRQFVLDRTRMLAAISHDLRTPLTRMRLRVELIDDGEQRRKMLRDLADMEDMVGATLAFAREDNAAESTEPVDLANLLETVAQDAALAQDAGLACAPVSFAGASPIFVDARGRALKRAIVNVADNAVRYGGGAEIALSRTAENAVVRIVDHGPGIPASERENVLRPFYRCEGSRSRETGGVGLGLSIASDIVRAHGGSLVLTDTPDGGLTVEITLPARQERAERPIVRSRA
jgi:signal transduction histidine kinase